MPNHIDPDSLELDKLAQLPETQDEWVRRMSLEVLNVTRSELYLDFR